MDQVKQQKWKFLSLYFPHYSFVRSSMICLVSLSRAVGEQGCVKSALCNVPHNSICSKGRLTLFDITQFELLTGSDTLEQTLYLDMDLMLFDIMASGQLVRKNLAINKNLKPHPSIFEIAWTINKRIKHR